MVAVPGVIAVDVDVPFSPYDPDFVVEVDGSVEGSRKRCPAARELPSLLLDIVGSSGDLVTSSSVDMNDERQISP